MVKAVFDNLELESPKNHFTIGIRDDVTGTSLDYDPSFSIEEKDVFRAVFFGLGSDGTVGANKESIKIIGENTENYAQAYFVYDSKKAGAITISHLRFGPRPIRSTYLVSRANFVGCHQPGFLDRYGVLDPLVPLGTFLLNTPLGPEDVWAQLPEPVQQQLVEKRPRFYVIDANKVARECKMGGRINTIMQTCFFAISGVLPIEEAIAAIKDSIRKTYGKKGGEIVQMNLNAVDQTLKHLFEVKIPESVLEHASGRETGSQWAPCLRAGGPRQDHSRVMGINSRSVHFRSMGLFPRAHLVGKNEIWRRKCPSGSQISVSSAANVYWFVPMRSFEAKSTSRLS